MSQRTRRTFTEEFKARAVELVRVSGKSASQVAKDLGLAPTVLRDWMRRAAEGRPLVGNDGVSVSEREELLRLRKEVHVLRMERDLLKKATAFFAKESK
jgi:transposase